MPVMLSFIESSLDADRLDGAGAILTVFVAVEEERDADAVRVRGDPFAQLRAIGGIAIQPLANLCRVCVRRESSHGFVDLAAGHACLRWQRRPENAALFDGAIESEIADHEG